MLMQMEPPRNIDMPLLDLLFLSMGEQFSGAQRNKSLSHFLWPNPSTSLLPMPQKKLFGFDDLLVKCSGLSHTR